LFRVFFVPFRFLFSAGRAACFSALLVLDFIKALCYNLFSIKNNGILKTINARRAFIFQGFRRINKKLKVITMEKQVNLSHVPRFLFSARWVFFNC